MVERRFNPKYSVYYDPRSGGWISVDISNQPSPLTGNHELVITLKSKNYPTPIQFNSISLDSKPLESISSERAREVYTVLLETLSEKLLETFDRDKKKLVNDKGSKGTLVFHLDDGLTSSKKGTSENRAAIKKVGRLGAIYLWGRH